MSATDHPPRARCDRNATIPRPFESCLFVDNGHLPEKRGGRGCCGVISHGGFGHIRKKRPSACTKKLTPLKTSQRLLQFWCIQLIVLPPWVHFAIRRGAQVIFSPERGDVAMINSSAGSTAVSDAHSNLTKKAEAKIFQRRGHQNYQTRTRTKFQ